MRPHAIGFCIAAAWAASAGAQPAAVVTKECGACHMVFPAQQLPARSWTAVMAGLTSHFGENAGLDAATTKEITSYLTAHAADVAGGNRRVMAGLSATEAPLRITETPYWIRKHNGRVTQAKLTAAKAKGATDCVACHAGAAAGQFEDD